MIHAIETEIPGLLVLEAPIHRDARGHFLELWRRDHHLEAGVPGEFALLLREERVEDLAKQVWLAVRGQNYRDSDGHAKLSPTSRNFRSVVARALRPEVSSRNSTPRLNPDE